MNNRLRIGFAITIILGAIYAFAGLFDSLFDFGIGLAVAAIGLTGWGCITFVEDHQHEHHERRQQMQRRPAEAWWRDV